MGGFWGRPGVKQPERTKAELEAAARALMGLPQLENKPGAVPENEDALLLREQIEAHGRVHEPVTQQEQFDSGAKVFGEKTMRDWETFHDQ
jgi:hypothetical protein